MAITFQKQPLTFFNVNEPNIFEFTSDADLGVNIEDLVADLQLKSLWTNRSYTVKNILPNYKTAVFRIDVSDYLKSLLLDNFEFDFNSPNKSKTIERFQIGISIHAENAQDSLADEFVFDSGYIFDTTFVFAETAPNDTNINTAGFYPILGTNFFADKLKPQKDLTKLNFLAPKYSEFCQGFTNSISIFVGELLTVNGTLSVGGIQTAIPLVTGVSTAFLNNSQISQMQQPTLLQTNLNNNSVQFYGIEFEKDYCEEVYQFRFYNSYGGYSYFYSEKENETGSRGKSEFINNRFYNSNENQSPKKQRIVNSEKSISFSGIKRLELKELFFELLNSPKIEIFLDDNYIECEITGNYNLRELDFEYNLKADLGTDLLLGL